MKQETKELIKWIKDRLERSKWENSFAKNEGKDIPNFDEDYNKAIEFLNSVTELENKLTKGGIIQDSKGNLCKDGDKVKVYYKKTGFIEDFVGTGTLKWDSKYKKFVIIGDDDTPNATNGLNFIFEKVE